MQTQHLAVDDANDPGDPGDPGDPRRRAPRGPAEDHRSAFSRHALTRVRGVLWAPRTEAPAWRRAGAAAALLVVLGCASPAQGPGAAPARLYVANAVDGTVSQVDAATGRVLGPPVPAGQSPDQIAPGPAGSLVTLSLPGRRGAVLTHAAPAGGGWTARPLGLAAPAGDALLAGDGGRYVAVTFPLGRGPAPPPGCQLVLVDVAAAARAPLGAGCAPGEGVSGVALGGGPTGPLVYLGVSGPAAPEGARGDRRGRLVAIEGATGVTRAVAPLAGAPSNLVLAPAPGGAGHRLYAVETLSRPEDESPGPYRGRLVGFDPLTLAPEGELPLPVPPGRVALAPDGEAAYALVAFGTVVLRLDLAAGTVTRLAELPGRAITLAVTRDRIYVPNPYGSEVWALDRRSGRLARTIPVGRGPLGVALVGGA